MSKIAIMGLGFVGSAVYDSILDKDEVIIYDPVKFPERDHSVVLSSDYIFICVPTPYNEGFDASHIDGSLKYLNDNNYNGIVIIKSTIHPIYLNKYKLKLVSNPEFLNEHTAIDDFRKQKLIILGGEIHLCHKVKELYENYFNLNVEEYIMLSLEEALIFKYLRNIKIGYDVMFWEFVEETTGNYRKYKHIMNKMPANITHIRADGKPGVGGSCLPKDISSYPKSELTEYLLKFNEKIRNNKGLSYN